MIKSLDDVMTNSIFEVIYNIILVEYDSFVQEPNFLNNLKKLNDKIKEYEDLKFKNKFYKVWDSIFQNKIIIPKNEIKILIEMEGKYTKRNNATLAEVVKFSKIFDDYLENFKLNINEAIKREAKRGIKKGIHGKFKTDMKINFK